MSLPAPHSTDVHADPALESAIARIPPGPWAVAVSGGADSVALLRLAADAAGARGDLSLHVVHLDHETRGEASTGDAAFVQRLADELRLPHTVATLSAVLAGVPNPAGLPANPSSRFRALRLELYRDVVRRHQLAGVLLAHHADDRAESVMLRLIRGSGFAGLAGMAPRSEVAGVTLLRPLLDVRREMLRAYLRRIGQPWREDASNASDDYARNRVRKVLADQGDLTAALLEVAGRCGRLREWVATHTQTLGQTFAAADVADLPEILATTAIADWLRGRGVPAEEVSPGHVAAVLTMCRDAASPARHTVPGTITIRRRRGRIEAEGMSSS